MSGAGRILLTGATGHLGAAIAAELVERRGPGGLRLLVRDQDKLARLSALDPRLAGLGDCERAVGDIRDPATLSAAVEGVDTVIHACHSHEYPRGTGYILDVNLGGAERLAEAAARQPGVRDLVYVGSYSCHDAKDAPGRDELAARSARGASSAVKATAQKVLREAADAGGYRMHVVSPSYMLGPYQLDPTYFGALFHVARFRPLTWHPPGGVNLIDVRDVARCVADCAALGDGPGASILASGDDVSFGDLFAAINVAAGHAATSREIPPRWMRRMPRLRFFGDFGKHYFDRPHYVAAPALAGRRHTLDDLVRDTLAFAARTGRYRSALGVGIALARRYL